MDFSDIKTLLELGINTSKFNYYHLAGDVTLNIETALLSIGVFNLDIPIDIKVLNNHGKVKVAVEFTNLPMLSIIGINLTPNNDGYTSAQNRKASFYWTDDLFYVYRTEQAKEKSWLGTPKGDFHDFELYGKYDGEYFLDNIIEILLRDILSLSDTIYDLIDSSATSGGSGEAHQIQYENVVSNFVFQKNEGIFKVGLDLNELTGLDLFNSTELTIKEDKNANILNDIYAVVSMTVGLKMTATIDIMLLDDYVENIDDNPGQYTTKIDSYVEAHKDDILNKKYKKYNGSAI